MNLDTNISKNSLLKIVKGCKLYAGVHAIEDIDFEIRAGEIHALLGENGAGKSTLCKAIAGAISLTSGDYILQGVKVNFQSPQDALRGGVAMVYQESSLVAGTTALAESCRCIAINEL